jgi:hypothetical protein
MAGMTTVLNEFEPGKENSRTWTLSGHTVLAPRLVIQKRKVPTSPSGVAESRVQVVYGTEDAEGLPLQSKVVFDAGVRYPANGQSDDITAALAVVRDLVASDEFAAMVTGQNYLA